MGMKGFDEADIRLRAASRDARSRKNGQHQQLPKILALLSTSASPAPTLSRWLRKHRVEALIA